jgi:hypothetical protein
MTTTTITRFPWPRIAVLLALVTAEVVVWSRGGIQALSQWLSVLGGGGVTVACLVWAAKGIQDWRSGMAWVEPAQLDHDAVGLATVVKSAWAREAVHRGITSPLPIAVQIGPADKQLAAHPAQWLELSGSEPDDLATGVVEGLVSGSAPVIADLYRRIPSRRLVILGEPGAGKTSAAILLLLDLLTEPLMRGRVPVLFPMASFNPAAESVEHWMTQQLAHDYSLPGATARNLVDSYRILPIFDGLDEIPLELRSMTLKRLAALPRGPLVLTCRTAEYRQAAAELVLDAAAVVQVIPVDPKDASAYLIGAGTADERRWRPVVDALRSYPPNPLPEVLRTPLMLSLARIVYRSPASTPAELLQKGDREQMQAFLFSGLISSVYNRHADISAADARRWLTFFADNLARLGPGAISWWRLPLCLPRGQLLVVGALAYAAIAVPAALVAWAAFVLTYAIPTGNFGYELRHNLAMLPGYLAVYVSLCAATGAVASTATAVPAHWQKPTQDVLVRNVSGKLMVATLACVASAVPLMYSLRPSSTVEYDDKTGEPSPPSAFDELYYNVSAVMLLIFAVVTIWLITRLTAAFSQTQPRTTTPLSSLAMDVRAGVGTGLLGGFAVQTGVIAVMLLDDLVFSDAYVNDLLEFAAQRLAYSIPAFIGGFLWFAPRRCASWAYAVSVMVLSRIGAVPRRPLRFLEDAYSRGVLRKVGISYEFRHASFAEYLRSTR